MVKKSLIIVMTLPLMIFAAEWQSLNGPPAGRADDMTIGYDSDIPAWVIYAADRTHKLYKSVNEGEYWDSIYTHDAVVYPICVITDKNNAQIIYIGKYDATPVWKSEDGGEIWQPKSSGITNNNPLCFAMDPNNSSIVYLGCTYDVNNPEPVIFNTTDGGETWSDLSSPVSGASIYNIAVFSGAQRILVSTNDPGSQTGGLFLSTDGGNTWSPKLGWDSRSVEISNSDPNYVYAIADDHNRIYRSEDRGDTWLGLNNPALFFFEIAIDPLMPGTLYVCTDIGAIFWSTDYGDSWWERNNGIPPMIDKMDIVEGHPGYQNIIYSSGSVALYKSTDYGAMWHESVKGWHLVNVSSTAADLPSLYSACAGVFKRSLNSGEDWETVYDVYSYLPGADFVAQCRNIVLTTDLKHFVAIRYPGFNGGRIMRSIDDALNWDIVWEETGGISELQFLTPHPTEPSIIYAALHPSGYEPYSVLRTTDGGHAWNKIGNFPSPYPYIPFPYQIIINPVQPEILYLGDNGWNPYNPTPLGVFRSFDSGENWNYFNDGFPEPRPIIKRMAIDIEGSKLYAGTNNGMYETSTSDPNWIETSNGIACYKFTDLLCDCEEPSIIYCSAYDNSAQQSYFYLTVDGAAQWIDMAGNLSSNGAWSVTIDQDYPNSIYVSTSNGIYYYDLPFNKSLVSSSSEATKSNSSRKMLRGGIDDFWITYESGGVIFAVHSTDGGRIWSKKMEIGYGCNPGISTNPNAETPEPAIVWRSQNHQTLYFARHISGSNWTSPTVLQTSVNGFGPPSFMIGTDNFGRVVYSEFDGQSDKIYLYKFHIYFPFPGVPALIDEGIDPSIDFMLPDGINPEIHVTWVKSNGVWYSSKFISGTSWFNKQRIIPFGVQPCIEVCGANVYVVCKRHKTISHRWASYFNGNPTWSGISVPNFSQTATHSVYPVLTGGWFCAWTEQESDSDIYFSYYDPALGWADPKNISNTTESSAHAHIVHKQTVNQTTIYFIWVEKDNAPYHIEFVSEIFGDRDIGEDYDLPFYIADGGEENASPFNLRREGYLQYGPEPYKRIDYDGQYLEYQFANLNPDREYGAGVYLYQHGSSNLAISAEVDGYQIGALNLPPDTLIILRHMVPAAFYADSMIHVKIYGNNAVSAILVLYEYEIEPDRGGPQSSQSLPDQAGVLSLSILPNPAKEIVGIRYTLPMATNVKLSLFDVTGRLIEHVVNENQPSGTYRKSFSNTNLSQGVYFVRLESDDKALVKKVIFLK